MTDAAGHAVVSHILSHWFQTYKGPLPELYLVGGAVRDMMTSRVPKDVDLVCKGAQHLARELASTRDAVVVPMEKKANEPCYRVVDGNECNNSIDIAELRGNNILEDLSRRDFTINAMASEVLAGGRSGQTIDPFNGTEDLKKGIIRAVAPGSFVSDPLRIMRAFRFSVSLNFEIEVSTEAEMEHHSGQIRSVSSERVLSELLSILDSPQSAPAVIGMDRINLLETIFPEIRPMKGCTQNSFHHRDVWQHSLIVMENCEMILNHLHDFFGTWSDAVSEYLRQNNRSALLKMAALFHDAGKPGTRDIDPETNRITFYGHDKKGAEIMDRMGERLRMSRRDREFLHTLVMEHLHVLFLSEPEVKKATTLRWFRKLRDDAIPAIILSMADTKGTLGADFSEEARERHLKWSQSLVSRYYGGIRKRLQQKSLITGSDLIALGMQPGPEMGRILKSIQDAQDTGEINDRTGAMDMAGRLIGKGGFDFS